MSAQSNENKFDNEKIMMINGKKAFSHPLSRKFQMEKFEYSYFNFLWLSSEFFACLYANKMEH